jgi:hypothetical protein
MSVVDYRAARAERRALPSMILGNTPQVALTQAMKGVEMELSGP